MILKCAVFRKSTAEFSKVKGLHNTHHSLNDLGTATISPASTTYGKYYKQVYFLKCFYHIHYIFAVFR